MTAPRQILAGSTYLVTRRCSQRQFLLKPSEFTNAVFGYLLAVAASRYRVEVHAFVVLSNHYHFVVTDPLAQLPAFSQYLDSLVARALNGSYGRWEHFWSPSSYSAVTLETRNSVVAKALYTLANPVTAALVAKGSEWPGLWSSPDAIGGPPLVFKRPKRFFAPKGQMPAVISLELKVPAGFTAEAFRKRLSDGLARAEARVSKVLRRAGKKPLGARRVLRQRHTDRPRTRERRGGLRPLVAADDRWKRLEAISRVRAFLSAHADALEMWRNGVRDAVFPPGTYWMRVFCGVTCAATG